MTLCGSLQIKRHVLKQEELMETAGSNTPIKDDVLNLGSGTKLSAEAIAKAVAHHNRHHVGGKPQDAPQKPVPGKKKK